jgi:hypothetical protein
LSVWITENIKQIFLWQECDTALPFGLYTNVIKSKTRTWTPNQNICYITHHLLFKYFVIYSHISWYMSRNKSFLVCLAILRIIVLFFALLVIRSPCYENVCSKYISIHIVLFLLKMLNFSSHTLTVYPFSNLERK